MGLREEVGLEGGASQWLAAGGLLGGAAEAFPWRVGGGSTDVSLHYVSLHC